MYIWTGIDVDEQLLPLKEKVYEIRRKLDFDNANPDFPFHMSLKISFFVNDNVADRLIDDIKHWYKTISPFYVQTDSIQRENSIVWLRYCDHYELNKIHDQLNNMLLSKYGIPLHEYDTDYKFHTTLFMNQSVDELQTAFELVKSEMVPDRVYVNSFLIGTSESGDFGTFKISHRSVLDE